VFFTWNKLWSTNGELEMMRMNRSSIVAVVALVTAVVGVAHHAWAGWNIDKFKEAARQTASGVAGGSRGLSNAEVVRGLKEALTIGARKAAAQASKLDGYYRNPRIKIPFPPEARKVKEAAEAIGLDAQAKRFVETLNRAAEEAAKEAAPIFVDAIKQLTIADGYKILKGPDDAATRYLRGRTTAKLTQKFKPVVRRAINKVQVTKYWSPLASNYNRVPFVKKVNPDLDTYVTDRAIKGLFVLIANEEKKIRKDPAARVTDLLRRVFG